MPTRSHPEATTRAGQRARVWACAASLLVGCAAPARYVIVTDATPTSEEQDSAERRLICLSAADARAHPGLVGLRTTSSVRRYGEERRGDLGAVELGLFQLVSGEYRLAEETVRARGAEIPEYLRRLLAADLAFERSRGDLPAAGLVKLYQDAYDVQESEKGRSIVALRVRQLRYGR